MRSDSRSGIQPIDWDFISQYCTDTGSLVFDRRRRHRPPRANSSRHTRVSLQQNLHHRNDPATHAAAVAHLKFDLQMYIISKYCLKKTGMKNNFFFFFIGFLCKHLPSSAPFISLCQIRCEEVCLNHSDGGKQTDGLGQLP